MTVEKLCRMGCNMQKLSRNEQNSRIEEVLKKFNIIEQANKYPYDLSGGQKQRVALAITLLNQPKILLLDEPTTFLDGVSKLEVWSFIEESEYFNEIPTVIVSHDPMEAMILGDRIYVLSTLARQIKEIAVPFSHPRSEEIYQEPNFWELRKQIMDTD
jgi:ABC-type nitrate/sulfonate/bicarbonate transport system ATPase subunit